MRLPETAYTSCPWRMHEIAPDFRVEDVWELPGSGRADDFPRLVAMLAATDPSHGSSWLARALFAVRWRLGSVLGWDDSRQGLGQRVPSLRARLPVGLRDTPAPSFDALPFQSLFLTEDEFAAEVANATVHGVLHLGAVPDGAGGFRARLTVLVRPNGVLGRGYLAAIKPFRHWVVYPAMMRDAERRWREVTGRAGS